MAYKGGEKEQKIKFWVMKGLFVLFILLLAVNYFNFKAELTANKDIFSFEYQKDIDVLLENKSLDYDKIYNTTQDNGFKLGNGLYYNIAEEEELEPNRCVYFYILLQRWVQIYLLPVFKMIGFLLIVRLVFEFVDFGKLYSGAKNEDNL